MNFDGLCMVVWTMIVLGVFVTRGVDQLFYQVDQKEPGTYQNFSQTFEGASLTTSKLDIFYNLILNMMINTGVSALRDYATEFSPWVEFFSWVLGGKLKIFLSLEFLS